MANTKEFSWGKLIGRLVMLILNVWIIWIAVHYCIVGYNVKLKPKIENKK
jgi:hypothetical protein